MENAQRLHRGDDKGVSRQPGRSCSVGRYCGIDSEPNSWLKVSAEGQDLETPETSTLSCARRCSIAVSAAQTSVPNILGDHRSVRSGDQRQRAKENPAGRRLFETLLDCRGLPTPLSPIGSAIPSRYQPLCQWRTLQNQRSMGDAQAASPKIQRFGITLARPLRTGPLL